MRSLLVLLLCVAPQLTAAAPPRLAWRQLQPGLAYATAPVAGASAVPLVVKDHRLHLLRVSPGAATLRAVVAARHGGGNRTAGEWAQELKLAAVINLGMYQDDHSTHVGYTKIDGRVETRRWKRYDSLLVMASKGRGARALLLDRDAAGGVALEGYPTVVQNLRLIRSKDGRTGEGVWKQQPKRWSEAALAMDREGNLLFVFCRAPLTMWELNRLLLSLPLGIVRAQHLEGGPEASLSIHAGGVDLDLCGSFETGFLPSDGNQHQWRLPNVLGVERATR